MKGVENMKKQQFEISIDHAMMIGAKAAFDTCLLVNGQVSMDELLAEEE